MAIYQASMLLAKLRNLTLVGQNEDKELEWCGTDAQWSKVDNDAERILREWDIRKMYKPFDDLLNSFNRIYLN